MKTIIGLALAGTCALAALTYHPITVCEPTSVKTEFHCNNDYCVATTEKPLYMCRPSHQ